MTDNEIIKALECCTVGTFDCSKECPCYSSKSNLKVSSCRFELMCEISDLINRQKAEIERLKKNIDGLNIFTKNHIKVIRLQAIKEFAERLKDEMRLEDDCRYDCMNCFYECKGYVPIIDNLVKEMTEV